MSKEYKLSNEFQLRHLGPAEKDLPVMLETVSASSLEDLINSTIPQKIRHHSALNLPDPISERDYLDLITQIAAKNVMFRSFIGLGYYNCITPSVIKRMVFENPGWYTQYTPYQAEISQGRLEALLNFQTMVIDLTGLEVANASLLDEGTAAAEAMTLLHRTRTREKQKIDANRFFISDTVFPQTIDVMKTRSEPLGIELIIGDFNTYEFTQMDFGCLIQYPDTHGLVNDYSAFIQNAHDNGVYVTMAADLMSLVLLRSPGELGADIAVGSTQRFGVPMGFGGPHAAYFATHEEFKRQMPGRIIGVSLDRYGNKAYRMALQTREQHIRREKATSNICTAQALLAIMAGMYAVYHGPDGLKAIAERIHRLTCTLDKHLSELGVEQQNAQFFDTLKIHLAPADLNNLRQRAISAQINLHYIDKENLGISLDETTTEKDVNVLVELFAETVGKKQPYASIHNTGSRISSHLLRNSEILTHPVFNEHHSETKMMRYIKKLENKDLSLTTSMIPLGSCTMKLNPATAMFPLSWPEFASIHPFVPKDQATGYQQVISELQNYLGEITGLKAVSLQPNSGAQGEYTGLMVIRAYQRNIGQGQRNITLIPSSAHGTNPASAVMAGMQVVIVNCLENGDIDIDDLREKALKYKDNLSSLMITYPSTHGVFEEGILEICEIIHANGGQVYMDGANMNAQVGLTSPGAIGADVCHLNLHKTFSIPHGGGGPGVGPICAADHLAPFLPGHIFLDENDTDAISAVASTPYGSASVLLISYAYIKMLGYEGLTQATKFAILNANYIKARLEKYYPVLFKGKNDRVAHELIFDLRGFRQSTGIEAEDVAKRLMDYGFHAPTMSWPVPGTIMVEPTESESRDELDRFCEAMLSIYEEIKAIETCQAEKEDNPLKNAPHTALEISSDGWEHPYTRQEAAYPVPYVKDNKFWPPVGRVDNTYGDRNLVCACPPIDAYKEE